MPFMFTSPRHTQVLLLCLFSCFALIESSLQADEQIIKYLNTPRSFPVVTSAEEWAERARQVREQVLVSCGLWPLPQKTPLNAKVFEKNERDGYSVEKVAIQTYPGFYLGGNLYRPLGKGKGPFPAILNPHGHWQNGRMADNKDGSIAARCITFARQGYLAFSYDMVGYNDTFFPNYGNVSPQDFYNRHRRFGTNDTDLLWSISLMGLQTWNSVRALDFLESLPDVDKKKLACTGESGGGTQTFVLGSIDDRLASQAPVVMVSHSMQGGCSCENVAGLRVQYSNMEIAAAPAPRPQILVAATGDWTSTTLTLEGPAIQKIYRLLNAQDRFHFVRFDYDHNYNQTSREAVYGWFGKWLLGKTSTSPVRESPYKKEADSDLLVWPNGELPTDARSDSQLREYLVQSANTQLQQIWPTNKRSLLQFQQLMIPAWKHSLQLSWPALALKSTKKKDGLPDSEAEYRISLSEFPESEITLHVQKPSKASPPKYLILATSESEVESLSKSSLASNALERGYGVITIVAFSPSAHPDHFDNFFCCYNRTKAQTRTADLITACSFSRNTLRASEVILCGSKTAGLWAILASPAADRVVADCSRLDLKNDRNLLANDVFYPGLRKYGGFETAALLAAPNPILLHNTGENFSTGKIQELYEQLGRSQKLLVTSDALPDWAIASWLFKKEHQK